MMSKIGNIDYSHNDIQLLLALQENPVQSYSELATKLDKSVKTISRWVSRLEENNLFYPTRAMINFDALGLEILYFIIEVKSLQHVDIIENFCNEHPYTTYRGRLNGAVNGLYVQFLAPNGTKNFYLKIFEFLKGKQIIVNYDLCEISDHQAFSTKLNLNNWNKDTLIWNFDWKSWNESMKTKEKPKFTKVTSKPFNKERFEALDEIDICILRLLNMNAKIKLKEINEGLLKFIKVTDSVQRISERLKHLKKYFISDYRLNLNSEFLNLYNTLLIRVTCKKEFSLRISTQLKEYPPPFFTQFIMTNNGFLWYLRIPSTHFSEVSKILWNSDEVERYEVSFLDYKTSEQYQFWEQNYNKDTKSWKNSEDYIFKDPVTDINLPK